MADKGSDFEFLSPASFEWDHQKRELNLAKHGIDFDGAMEVFYGPIILHRSDRNNDNRLIVVVLTRRADVIRIISARRARKNEESEYRNAEVGRPPEGHD
jgi:uncharacterized DUF497 family protein